MDKLYDISEVCTRFGTTSRTLRYYEAEGLIKSTVHHPSTRRRYTEAQVGDIQKILALRALGLSVKTILALQENHTTLEDAILLHRAELIRLLAEKQTEINLLEEVLCNIKDGNSPETQEAAVIDVNDRQLEVADICTEALLGRDYAACMPHFGEDLRILLPEAALARSWELAVDPVGTFKAKGKRFRAAHAPNIVIRLLHYEHMTVRVKFVFHGNSIHGLWTDYTE